MAGTATLANEDTFHKARGKLLDAFARVEKELVKKAASSEAKPKADTLSTKIKRLRDLKCGQLNPKAEVSLDRLNELNAIRVDIVHGVMALLDDGDERFAVFTNAKFAAEPIQPAIKLTHKSLRDLVAELAEIESAISTC